MKNAIITLFAIHLTSVIAIREQSIDLRYPIDARIIQGILNKSNFMHVYYELSENEKVIDYRVSVYARACGPYKIELDDNYKFAKRFHILPLNQDKILLVPISRDSKIAIKQYATKFEIIDFSQCQRIEVVFPAGNQPTELQITKYFDSFDIYYKDSSVCKDNFCRKSYDFKGNNISAPINKLHSSKSVPIVKPVGSELRSDNYLAIEFTRNIIVNLAQSDNATVLAEIKDTQFSPEVSTSNNLISLAYRVDGINLNLTQFDLKGNLKFKTFVKYNFFVRTAKVLNAPDGGAYLVSSECDRDHCDDERNSYTVKKFDANGKELGSLPLKFPLPGIIEDLSFYEDKGSFCLTRAQQSLGVSGEWLFKKLDIITKCFTDEDLS